MLCAVQVQSILAEGLQVSGSYRSTGRWEKRQPRKRLNCSQRTASSPSCTPTAARTDAADGADRLATEATPLAQTGVCAPGGRPRGPNRPTVLSLCGGCPAPLGVTDLSRDAMPNRLNVRVSDEELEALRRASAELSCSRSQVVRLLIHCLADGEARMGFGTVAFDYETSHGIVRNLRSIGTLYNQSVAALNTIAKVARES